jgi:hypothetical protein
MGMPCEINTILKLRPEQGYPQPLVMGECYQVSKEGYRIFPVDVPISLVDEDWVAHGDVVIRRLVWEEGRTLLKFEVVRLDPTGFRVK